MRRLILDTDMDTDVDDAGALSIVHALRLRGEVEVLGVICSVPMRDCALCACAINAEYGAPDIPVGLVNVPDWDTAPRHAAYRRYRQSLVAQDWRFYNAAVGATWERDHPGVEFPDAVRLYRQLLAGQPDQSVIVCAVGTLTALAQLIDSGPDEASPLSGAALVAAKVPRLVTMALGTYPRGEDRFNWRMDTVGAARVINDWPGPVTVSELGELVRVGPRFVATAPPDHPVRRAYEIWTQQAGRDAVQRGRSSWDQIAVVRAVQGCGSLFREHGGLGLHLDPRSGRHEWQLGTSGPERTWFETTTSEEDLARHIENLMIESLE